MDSIGKLMEETKLCKLRAQSFFVFEESSLSPHPLALKFRVFQRALNGRDETCEPILQDVVRRPLHNRFYRMVFTQFACDHDERDVRMLLTCKTQGTDSVVERHAEI